jgi:hypothetical protein
MGEGLRRLADLTAQDTVVVFCAIAEGHGLDLRRATAAAFLVSGGGSEGVPELRNPVLLPFARALSRKRVYEVFDLFGRLRTERFLVEDPATAVWRTLPKGMDAAQRLGAWRWRQRVGKKREDKWAEALVF